MKYLPWFVAVVVGLSGCHTFVQMKPNFEKLPVESLKAVADEIETAVQKGEREPTIADRDGIIVNTDAMKQAIRTRAIRAKLVETFLETGHAAEMNNGLITVLRTSDYKHFGSSRDRNRTALLIDSENADRWAIYEGILNASHFHGKSLGAIQRTFFDARLKLLVTGLKYEDDSGKIVKK